MEQDVLRMEGITKIYGNGILANDNVDFYLRQGEIHALMGENLISGDAITLSYTAILFENTFPLLPLR